ncbi:YggT family protein [uncultured Desulfovibrio sp.]|uniref:YggT family protein n=1 Tax=Candidatus Desulfovibrio intestinavium TaxID=2838534 RepID=A0A9D2HPN5_9BACT|nr:YggT family protein [uncultured Desulfovibrio sp.]HJA80102.1 YggT family protein [Candidatus Desulfovibrio intestinavium]
MFVIQNILLAVGNVLGALLNLYFWIVVIAAVISWVRPDPFNPIVRALRVLTEPVFYYVRKWMPFTYRSGLDFSPVVVLLAIQLVKQIVVASLIELAARL